MGNLFHRWSEKITQNKIWKSIFRHGYPDTELNQSLVMYTNLFLHIQPVKVHKNVLRPSYTLGLGLISFVLFLVLVVTGIYLMFYYVPSVDRAYNDMKELQFVVSFGIFLRNLHRWSAHGMVAAVFLHMCRVFYTASYKPPREFNWVLGVILLIVTFGLSFTGYLLPWDQLAFWAITVGTSIASYAPIIGQKLRYFLLGGNIVGQNALLRFYVLHCVVLPSVAAVLIGIHFWRIRKDGGLSKPAEKLKQEEKFEELQEEGLSPKGTSKTYGLMELVKGATIPVEQEPENEIMSWPHLIFREFLVAIVVLVVLIAISLFFNAPLEELANPSEPPNPAKAPWYFLGLQELVSYSAFIGGVITPFLVVFALLMAIPYIDYRAEDVGIWFSSKKGRLIALITATLTLISIPVLIFLNMKYGIRVFYPDAPSILVDLINPGTILIGVTAVISIIIGVRTKSWRLAAMMIFTSFVTGFIVLTVIGTLFRGPNWEFVFPWKG